MLFEFLKDLHTLHKYYSILFLLEQLVLYVFYKFHIVDLLIERELFSKLGTELFSSKAWCPTSFVQILDPIFSHRKFGARPRVCKPWLRSFLIESLDLYSRYYRSWRNITKFLWHVLVSYSLQLLVYYFKKFWKQCKLRNGNIRVLFKATRILILQFILYLDRPRKPYK
jgi:hypothetical protein